MSYDRSCIGGVHVFRMAYLTIYCVFCWKSCLTDGHVFMRVCIIGGMFCSSKCLTFYWRVYLIGSLVIHEGMSYRWTCLVGAHVV